MLRGNRLKKTPKISKRTAKSAAAKTQRAGVAARTSEPGATVASSPQIQHVKPVQTTKTLKKVSPHQPLPAASPSPSPAPALQLTQLVVFKSQQASATTDGTTEDPPPPANLLDKTMAGKLVAALKHAVDLWKVQAKFRDIQIFGSAATGGMYCLEGPDLESLITGSPAAAGLSGTASDLMGAFAEGVADCFGQWQDKVTVPGLMWYPAFAVYPGPQAGPLPNVPTPLAACISTQASQITLFGELEGAMVDALPNALRTTEIEQGLQQLAKSIALAFTTWLVTASVQNVKGEGPVPSFAPPFVPVGPVVDGSVISEAGHLATAPTLALVVPPALV